MYVCIDRTTSSSIYFTCYLEIALPSTLHFFSKDVLSFYFVKRSYLSNHLLFVSQSLCYLRVFWAIFPVYSSTVCSFHTTWVIISICNCIFYLFLLMFPCQYLLMLCSVSQAISPAFFYHPVISLRFLGLSNPQLNLCTFQIFLLCYFIHLSSNLTCLSFHHLSISHRFLCPSLNLPQHHPDPQPNLCTF